MRGWARGLGPWFSERLDQQCGFLALSSVGLHHLSSSAAGRELQEFGVVQICLQRGSQGATMSPVGHAWIASCDRFLPSTLLQ